MSCQRCGAFAASTDLLFSPNGESLCRVCYNAEQSAAMNQRAATSSGGAPFLQPASSSSSPFVAGLAIMGGAALWFVVGVFALDRIFFYPFILFAIGFAQFARGLALRRAR